MTIARDNFQGHPYHLVEPSPWPLLTSIALLTLTSSGVIYFHGFANALTFVALGFFTTLFAMILWFRDVSAEGTYLGNHTFAVQRGLSLGVALFIVSEIFFFLSFFWGFYHSALSPTVELGSHWPPQGIDALSPYEIPLLNTIILLSSGASVTYAHHSLIQGNRRGTIFGILITVILAALFTRIARIRVCRGAVYDFRWSIWINILYSNRIHTIESHISDMLSHCILSYLLNT